MAGFDVASLQRSDPQRGDEDVSPSPGPIDDADGAATQSHGVGDVA